MQAFHRLSAVFDITDHNTLLGYLKFWFGLSGNAISINVIVLRTMKNAHQEQCPSDTMPIRTVPIRNFAHQQIFKGRNFAYQFFLPIIFLLNFYLFKGLIILGKECLLSGLRCIITICFLFINSTFNKKDYINSL